LPGGKTLVWVLGVPGKIQTRHLYKSNLQRYSYASMLRNTIILMFNIANIEARTRAYSDPG